MPTVHGIRAGAAYVELYARDNRLTRGLRRASARLRAFSMSVRQAGMSMLRLSALMAVPFAIGTKVFADFEEQMAMVSTMLDRPEEHMERFRQRIREMSVEFGESTETLARGLYDILSASVPAEPPSPGEPPVPDVPPLPYHGVSGQSSGSTRMVSLLVLAGEAWTYSMSVVQ